MSKLTKKSVFANLLLLAVNFGVFVKGAGDIATWVTTILPDSISSFAGLVTMAMLMYCSFYLFIITGEYIKNNDV